MANTPQAVEEKIEEPQNQQDNTAPQEQKTQVQTAEFPEAAAVETAAASGSIDILLDMDVPVTIVIGQTEIAVRRLLQLGPGSVLKLDKSVDAPVDLYLKDIRFAAGDVVVVDGRFAVRIKQIFGTPDSSRPAGK